MSPKQAFEYIAGIDLWRDYRAKEQAIYDVAGLPEDHNGIADLSFRGMLEVQRERFVLVAHHTGRSTLVLAGVAVTLKATEILSHL